MYGTYNYVKLKTDLNKSQISKLKDNALCYMMCTRRVGWSSSSTLPTAIVHVCQDHSLKEPRDVKLDFPGLYGLRDQISHTTHRQHAGLMDLPPRQREG
jgi:hypothetical protein